MNTRKTVYNKLFSEKTELAKHEVELALLDNISTFLKNYSIFSDAVPIRQAAEKAEKSLNLKKEKLTEILTEIEKGKRMVQELGLPLKDFENLQVMANGQMKITNTLIKNVQSAKFVDNI